MHVAVNISIATDYQRLKVGQVFLFSLSLSLSHIIAALLWAVISQYETT